MYLQMVIFDVPYLYLSLPSSCLCNEWWHGFTFEASPNENVEQKQQKQDGTWGALIVIYHSLNEEIKNNVLNSKCDEGLTTTVTSNEERTHHT